MMNLPDHNHISPDMEVKADVYIPVTGIWKVWKFFRKKIKEMRKEQENERADDH